MDDAHRTVMARSSYLWIAAGLAFGLTIVAAATGSIRLIEVALIVNGVLAIVGIGFGSGPAARSHVAEAGPAARHRLGGAHARPLFGFPAGTFLTSPIMRRR